MRVLGEGKQRWGTGSGEGLREGSAPQGFAKPNINGTGPAEGNNVACRHSQPHGQREQYNVRRAPARYIHRQSTRGRSCSGKADNGCEKGEVGLISVRVSRMSTDLIESRRQSSSTLHPPSIIIFLASSFLLLPSCIAQLHPLSCPRLLAPPARISPIYHYQRQNIA